VRRFPLLAVMISLVAAVLGVSLWNMHRAGQEAMREARARESQLAKETGTSLRGLLEWFDRDTRLLAGLARGTRKQAISSDAQDRTILASFEALVTVVAHYRTLSLIRKDAPGIVAVDPTEDRRNIPPLTVASARTAQHALDVAWTALDGPETVTAGRPFYIYAAPVSASEAVVVTSDAAMMLEASARLPVGNHQLVVVDPSGAVWLGCDQREHCRLFEARSTQAAAILATIASGAGQDSVAVDGRLASLGLPPRIVVGTTAPVQSPLGVWSVSLIASASEIDVRQRAFLLHLVITSLGVATAMLTVGLFILRQHTTAAALKERLHAAEEVATLQRQLVRAEKLVTVGVLSAGIAHEIGTPLSVVRGRAEHMLERGAAPRAAADLRAIVAEIDRISSTISQILEFSREHSIEVTEVDARAAVTRARELLELRLAGKQIAVKIDAPDELPPVSAAPDQLEQVMVNLLMNACDASSPGSEVRVALDRDPAHPDRLRIAITDRGVGIPPEHLNAVFDPYFTTKKQGDGSGLGLAMVWQIVRSHRAEISLKSVPGEGTVATLSWPAASAAPAAKVAHG
jgi:signal transduction histidine kinase